MRLDALVAALGQAGVQVTAAAMPEADAGVLELQMDGSDEAAVLAAMVGSAAGTD